MSAATGSRPDRSRAREPLPRNVRAFGWTSFLTDVSTDAIYPLLPTFLTVTLGASTVFVGLVEGIAESTAALIKVASGWWSDRVRRRLPFAILGYGLSAATRPLVAVAAAGWHVLGARFLDRVGKGLRTSPRDALLASSISRERRGEAFGWQRAMDNAGAVAGPLLAFALLAWMTDDLRVVFALAFVPAVLSVVVLVVGAREVEAPDRLDGPRAADAEGYCPTAGFRRYLLAFGIFTLGNSSDAFLLLRASSLGIPEVGLPLLWAGFNGVKALVARPAGALSDRVGRRRLILAGWTVYAVVYAGLAAADAAWHMVLLMLLYGVVHGLTEGAERAWVADLHPAGERGRAFGLFHGVTSVTALPASLLAGWLWMTMGPAAAFSAGAGLALLAIAILATARAGPPPDAA